MINLRWVNHANHASLAMSNLTAVEPNRVCIIDSQRPDRLKKSESYTILKRQAWNYLFLISGRYESTKEASIAHWMAWVIKSGLDNWVIAWIEMKLDNASCRDVDSVGFKDKTILTNVNWLRGTWSWTTICWARSGRRRISRVFSTSPILGTNKREAE